MAVPNPNPTQSWKRLGTVVPRDIWQPYSSFTGTPNAFRLTAFSLTGEYDRHCFLRIKYSLSNSNPIYSRWFKVYPKPVPTLWTPQIFSEFAAYSKTIESLDYFRLKIKKYHLHTELKWSLAIDYLEA